MTATSLLRTPMTQSLAYAFGQQAGNNSMHRAGRVVWNAEDANVAAVMTNTAMLSAIDVSDAIKARIEEMLQ